MPVYTYRCENCQHEFDKEQSFYDDPLKKCPECKKNALRKVYKPARVVFKGSGFYVTDNRGSKSATVGGNGKSESSENGKSEKKTEATSEKKTEKKESKAKES